MTTVANPTAAAQGKQQSENPLKALARFGQSVWLDYIRRNLLVTGELARLIDEDGLRGMTSNPAIFEKAIAGSTDYAQELDELAKQKDLDAKAIFEHLAIRVSKMQRTSCGPSIFKRNAATATSAWKFLLTWPTKRAKQLTRRAASGALSLARTS